MVAPVLHTLPDAALLVKVTLPPVQKVVAPDALIIGVAGVVFTVTTVPVLVPVHPLGSVTVTV